MRAPAVQAATLVLEDGRVFRGRSLGAPGQAVGEVVFNTAMTGYQEIISDPSYAGQIITFTYPLIGNVGVNDVDLEARVPHCQGIVLRRASPVASNYRSRGRLTDWLCDHGLVALEGIDTRALTRHLRARGALRGVLATAAGAESYEISRLVEAARRSAPMQGRDLTGQVGCETLMRFAGTGRDKQLVEVGGEADPFAGGAGPRVLVLDFGAKHGILEQLVASGARVVLAPARTGVEAILALGPDGVLLSNGPGDPAAVGHGIDSARELVGRLPILGICLGHQLLSLALGLETVKLKFGHHGANHPVRAVDSGRVLITSQNHGFAVKEVPPALAASVRVTHTSLYDGTIEGIEAPAVGARSIQFHPEASPGPHDARPILERFVADLAARAARPTSTHPAAEVTPATEATPCPLAATSTAS